MNKDKTLIVEVFVYSSETGCESRMDGKKKYFNGMGNDQNLCTREPHSKNKLIPSMACKTPIRPEETESCIEHL